MAVGGPVDADGRIGALDAIRGFALFGVLWMNLFEHADFVFPASHLVPTLPPVVDRIVGFAARWLVIGKAQALFSILFGFGFAMFLARAEAAGRDGTRLYLRRVGFLLVLGFAHAVLLWAGDILNAYAMMGLLLVFTRRWSGRTLLVVGLPLAILGMVADRLVWEHVLAAPGVPLPYYAMMEEGAVRRMPLFLGHDYPAYVAELWRVLIVETYGVTTGVAYLGWVFGRFLIGAWLFRRGWLERADADPAAFRRLAAMLLGTGMAMALVDPLMGALGMAPGSFWPLLSVVRRGAQLVLALGYAAGLVVLFRHPAVRRRLSGLAAAGRMALTNYLAQSLLYFFLLYGFGAGLMFYMTASVSLVVALIFFAAQIGFSRWWLARYRFGPAEWVWRSWTYRHRQPMRRAGGATPAGATAT